MQENSTKNMFRVSAGGVVKTKPKTGWSKKDVHHEWYLYYLLRLTCRSIKCEGKREVIILSGHHGPKPTPTQPLSRHDLPQYSYKENIILPKIKMCLMVPQPNSTQPLSQHDHLQQFYWATNKEHNSKQSKLEIQTTTQRLNEHCFYR